MKEAPRLPPLLSRVLTVHPWVLVVLALLVAEPAVVVVNGGQKMTVEVVGVVMPLPPMLLVNLPMVTNCLILL